MGILWKDKTSPISWLKMSQGGHAPIGAPFGGGIPACLPASAPCPPRNSSSITSARGNTQNQALLGTHGLYDSRGQQSSKNPCPEKQYAHSWIKNSHTPWQRTLTGVWGNPEGHSQWCVFSDAWATDSTPSKNSVSLAWAGRLCQAWGLLQLPPGLPPLLVLRENLPEGLLRLRR